MEKIIAGNVFNKYASNNPIYKSLINNFKTKLWNCITKQQPLTILEPGCGEGFWSKEIIQKLDSSQLIAFDIDRDIINQTKSICPNVTFNVDSIYDLTKYKSLTYDYILVLEVLEHLERPNDALLELSALMADKYIFSIPNEPIWRLLNISRLKYLKKFGNTPGHIQHWNKNSFKKLISQYFEVIEINSAFPWLIAICQKYN
jgi:2-polyprenyl-3-methyl-5-hydroxy-6-metoxy-1,4-benzoquinol methylase